MSKKTASARLAEHTDTSDPTACWVWGGAIDRDGYGRANRKMAHREVWEGLVNPIPEGHELDHLCRNRACVNPEHLEVVTRAENNRRMHAALEHLRPKPQSWQVTHCKNGHEFTEENTYRWGGRRSCCACGRINQARATRRKKLATNPPPDNRDPAGCANEESADV